jgi:hypothetical protein
MNPRQKEVAAAAAVTVLGVVLAFAPAVVGLRTLSQRDTDQLYAPVRTLVVEELRAGRLPLWNPYEGTGKPLFAEGIHSVLHPVSLLGALVAPSSIDFLILSYLVAAALGSFLFARTLGASPPASAAAGLAFALSGFSASMTGNLVFLAGLSTLPWLLAAARAAGDGARWGPVATALATACAFLSGDVQVALVGLLLGTLLAADAGGPRGAARALLGMLPGILLAAVQINATRALLPRSYRAPVLSDWERARWALPPARLLEWIVPGLYRGPLREVPVLASGNPVESVFAESVYLGAPVLVAAALGAAALVRSGRRRAALVLGGAVAVSLWLALGHHLGARQLLDWVPIWSRFRYTEKLMAPLTLCVSALAALGVDAFGSAPFARSWRLALAAALLTAAATLLFFLLAPWAAQGLSERLLDEAGTFRLHTLSGGLPHLLVLLVALLAADRLRSLPARVLALSALVALAPAAALSFGAHFGSTGARRLATPFQLQTDSPTPRLLHPEEELLPTNDPEGPVDGAARFNRRFLRPSINVAYRVDTVEPFGAFDPGRLTTLVRSLGFDWMHSLRRFALTHVAIVLPYDEASRAAAASAVEGGELLQREPLLNFELWSVPHRAWAFFARSAVAQPRAPEAHMVLLDVMARGDDETMVVEATEPPPTAPGRVLRVQRGTETVVVEAESDAPSLLVVQDAFWPGWRATIDGRATEILAADFLVRAVQWPTGRHTLVMTYDPPEIRLGLVLSALGALLVLVLAAFALRRPAPAP